jgi:hypothetical protein
VESKFSEAWIPAKAEPCRVRKVIIEARMKDDDLSRIVVLSVELAIHHLRIV